MAFSGEATEITEAHLILDFAYPKRSVFARDRLNFTFLPEEISEDASPNWDEIAVIGRSEPYQGYNSTSANEISFDLNFVAQNNTEEDVKKKVDWIKSLKYPVYVEGIAYSPPTLMFVFGKLFTRRVIVSSASVTWMKPWEILETGSLTLLPMMARVSLSLKEVNTRPKSAQDVEAGR